MLREHGAHPERPRVAGRRARQIRMRIVALVRVYRARCAAYEQANADAHEGAGPIAACEEAGEAMDQARNALFSALDELDMLEEGA